MNTEVAGDITAWLPSSAPAVAAAFARQVVARAAPAGRDRARTRPWAAGKLAGVRHRAGPGPGPGGAAAPVGDRAVHHLRAGLVRACAARCARTCGSSPGSSRQLNPADAPLPRERAKVPYTAAEIGGYLALADAQPWQPRGGRAPPRWSASGQARG